MTSSEHLKKEKCYAVNKHVFLRLTVKGQCHEIFDLFFCSKNSTGTPWQMNRLKRFHVDTRFSRISSRKRKISRNRFCLFIWGPCRVFLSRKMYRKSRFTVPLNGQSRICLYFKESSTVLTVKVRACHLYNFKKCLVIAVCFYACSLMHNDNVD